MTVRRAVPARVRAGAICLIASTLFALSTAALFALPAAADAATPSSAKLARSLTSHVLRAHSAGARARVMLQMMRALRISVVTPAGKPLVVAPELNAARLFELYSSELGPLGAAAGRAPTLRLDDVGADLARSGLTLAGKGTPPVPSTLLRTSLIAAVKDAARHPSAGSSLLPLIVRELGLRQRPAYDLARHPSLSQIHLDGLQAFLITADTDISVLRHVRYLPLAGDPGAGGSTAAHAASAGDVCQKLSDASDALDKALDRAYGGKLQHAIGSFAIGKIGDRIKKETREAFQVIAPEWVDNVDKAGNIAKIIGEALEGIHGSLLSVSISVHTVNNMTSVPDVHWYHTPGEAGHERQFQIVVEMLDDYGKSTQKCGDLLGFKFPAKGGIPKVPVLWEQAQGKLTPDMGKLSCNSLACVTYTDNNGLAQVTFTPNTELFPGVGLQLDSSGVLDGVAAYQTGAGAGKLAQIAQVLVPKFAGLRWRVTYHKEPKLSLHVTQSYDATFTNQNEGGPYVSTGTGSRHEALSSLAPLTRVTTQDGASVWTGSGAIQWDGFSFHDHGGKHVCTGPAGETLDEDGSAPVGGQLTVDSLQVDPTNPVGGLAVTLHSPVLPSFTQVDTVNDNGTGCGNATYTSHPGAAFPRDISGAGVTTLNPGDGLRQGETVKVTNWTPGPAAASHGYGVYAYRDFPVTTTSPWGEPITKDVRLEILLSPGS